VESGQIYALAWNNWFPVMPNQRLVGDREVLEYGAFPWVTSSHFMAYAGFYSHEAGVLPYSFGDRPRELYVVATLRVEGADAGEARETGSR